MRDRKILEVHVDKGMTDGQKIVFSGEGDQEPELEAGDLIIVLDEKENDVSIHLYLQNLVQNLLEEIPLLLYQPTYSPLRQVRVRYNDERREQ